PYRRRFLVARFAHGGNPHPLSGRARRQVTATAPIDEPLPRLCSVAGRYVGRAGRRATVVVLARNVGGRPSAAGGADRPAAATAVHAPRGRRRRPHRRRLDPKVEGPGCGRTGDPVHGPAGELPGAPGAVHWAG